MKSYYVNTKPQPTGEHEVHTGDCIYLPNQENRIYLGYFETCQEALTEAKKTYSNVDGCYYCSNSCHKK